MSITIIVHQAPRLSDEVMDFVEIVDWVEMQDDEPESTPVLIVPVRRKQRKARMTIVIEEV